VVNCLSYQVAPKVNMQLIAVKLILFIKRLTLFENCGGISIKSFIRGSAYKSVLNVCGALQNCLSLTSWCRAHSHRLFLSLSLT